MYTLVPLAAAAALKGDDAWAARILGARDAVAESTGATIVLKLVPGWATRQNDGGARSTGPGSVGPGVCDWSQDLSRFPAGRHRQDPVDPRRRLDLSASRLATRLRPPNAPENPELAPVPGIFEGSPRLSDLWTKSVHPLQRSSGDERSGLSIIPVAALVVACWRNTVAPAVNPACDPTRFVQRSAARPDRVRSSRRSHVRPVRLSATRLSFIGPWNFARRQPTWGSLTVPEFTQMCVIHSWSTFTSRSIVPSGPE